MDFPTWESSCNYLQQAKKLKERPCTDKDAQKIVISLHEYPTSVPKQFTTAAPNMESHALELGIVGLNFLKPLPLRKRSSVIFHQALDNLKRKVIN